MIAALIRTLNEEAQLEQCIRYHKPYVDYISVVDGGSTDNTVEIAERLADKVTVDTDRHWGRFTTNAVYSLPDYILWVLLVDADERFDLDYLHRMRSIIDMNTVISYRFPRINLPNARNYPNYQIRLMRTDKDIVWMNYCHEAPTLNGELLNRVNCLTLHKYPIIHQPRRVDVIRPWWIGEEDEILDLDKLKQTYSYED